MYIKNFFRRSLSPKTCNHYNVASPALTMDIYEVILTQLFSFILTTDIFFFVKNPGARKEVLRIRTVCKQWDQVLRRILPIKKHLKIEKSCCNNEPAKGKILESNITDSLFVNGFSNSLVLHLCVSHFTLDLSEKFGPKITHMYLQSVDGIAGFLPRIVKNTKNLETLVLSDCYWIGRLSLSSNTLKHFTLFKVVGLEILQLKCHNLATLTYNECNLSPLLSCENHLKILTNTHSHFSVHIGSLYIEQVEIISERAKSTSIEINNCCGNKIRIKSRELQNLTFRQAKYGKIVTACPRLRSFRLDGVKMLKRLVLDSPALTTVHLGRCVVKSLSCGTNLLPQTIRGAVG